MSPPLTVDDMMTRYPGTNRQSWANYRYRGNGPKFFRVGRKIFYRLEDIEAWESETAVSRSDERAA